MYKYASQKTTNLCWNFEVVIKPKVLINTHSGVLQEWETWPQTLIPGILALHPKMHHPKLNKQTFTNNNGHCWIPLTSSTCSLPTCCLMPQFSTIFNYHCEFDIFFIIKNLGFNKLDSIKPFVQPIKKLNMLMSKTIFYFYFYFCFYFFWAVQRPMLIGVKSPWLLDHLG